MTKSARGAIHDSDKNVKQKSGLNKAILQQNWMMLIKISQYHISGGVIMVPATHTSQGCSFCAFVSRENMHGRLFICVRCGFTCHTDCNAARNI